MNADQTQDRVARMKALVDPWYQSLADPAKAQATMLERLLADYRQTEYGRKHGADAVGSYEDFKNAFPVQTYAGFKPLIDQVLAGDTHALLSEEPGYIALTKGTGGEPKLFPWTQTHAMASLNMVLRLNSNYAITKRNFEWMAGYRLNLSSSANVGTINVGGKEMPYGYSIAVGMRILEATGRAALKRRHPRRTRWMHCPRKRQRQTGRRDSNLHTRRGVIRTSPISSPVQMRPSASGDGSFEHTAQNQRTCGTLRS